MGRLEGRLPTPEPSATGSEDFVPDFAAYRQPYLEQQRRMEMMIDPLRAHCRQVLAQASPGLAKLAELDAVMEQTLGEREKALLGKLSRLLELRFRLRRPESAGQGGATSQPFMQEWLQLLIAEMDFRLEPIAGMVEALQNIGSTR